MEGAPGLNGILEVQMGFLHNGKGAFLATEEALGHGGSPMPQRMYPDSPAGEEVSLSMKKALG